MLRMHMSVVVSKGSERAACKDCDDYMIQVDQVIALGAAAVAVSSEEAAVGGALCVQIERPLHILSADSAFILLLVIPLRALTQFPTLYNLS